ncbi:MAG: two-component regulator propeller domain-containing protein [Motiliproteus sp.]
MNFGLMGRNVFFKSATVVALAAAVFAVPVVQAAEAPADTGAAEAKVESAQYPAKSKFTHFRVGQRNVKSIFSDRDGVMWVGTSGGAIRYDTKTDEYRHFDVRNGLLANGVFHVSRIGSRVAVGTYGGGLAMLDESTGDFHIYNVPDGLGDAFVYDVLEAENGDAWIATWTGVNRIRKGELDNPDAWEIHTVKSTSGGLPNDWVYGLAQGKNNDIWLATEGGLTRYNYADQSWTNWQHADGLGAPYEMVKSQSKFSRDPAKYSSHHAQQKIEQGLQGVDTAYNPNYIVALEVDHNGQVWAGTWGAGLSRFDGKEWSVITVSDGLPSNHIFMLHEDAEQNMWIGTSHGLAMLPADGAKMKLYDMEDGLFSNAVFSMDTQQDGTLWIGSFGGVARINHLDD